MEIYTNIFYTSSQELLKSHIETILAILFDSNQTTVENKASYLETGGFIYSHEHKNVGSAIIKDRGSAIEFTKKWTINKNEAIRKSLSALNNDFKFQGAFFPLQYMKVISVIPVLNEKIAKEVEAWELIYKLELPSYQSEDTKDKASIYNAGIKLKLGTNGNMQEINYNLLPIERVQKTILNKVLANESDSPELTFIFNNETNNITPFYFTSSDFPFIQASNQSFLPSSLLVKKKKRKKTYERNYEEKIGLTEVPHTPGIVYEDYFIDFSSKIKSVVNDFLKSMPSDTSTNFSAFKILITEYGQKLLNAAIEQAKSDPDDRPLYWARIKMQVALKSHPFFKRSGGNRRLSKLIELFEEKSRNYTGIDFSEADKKGLKKVLITGFDPFELDSNPEQWNPSGIAVLSLKELEFSNSFIQFMIFPVRYEDFDLGYVEKYILPYINSDMIMTVSQGRSRYDIERFASKYRSKTSTDNLGVSGITPTHYLPVKNKVEAVNSDDIPEFLENELPISSMIPGSLGNKEVVYNQQYKSDKSFLPYSLADSGTAKSASPVATEKALEGSGGTYLSNEIFFRVSALRNFLKLNDKLKSGHLHVPILPVNDISAASDYITKIKKIIQDAIDGL
ncbi:MAG: hypothetical protein ACK4K0_09490 [Flavobacteriales bacterium]